MQHVRAVASAHSLPLKFLCIWRAGLCALTEDCMGIEWSGPRRLPSIVRNTRACLCLCWKRCLHVLTSLRISLCGATSAAVTLTHCSSLGHARGPHQGWGGNALANLRKDGSAEQSTCPHALDPKFCHNHSFLLPTIELHDAWLPPTNH